jgi:hypothetical protein
VVFGSTDTQNDLLAAIAAAFADQRVDEHALLRIFHLAALAPTPFFGGAGLVVDEDGNALDLAHAFLHGIQFIAMDELDAGREDFRFRPFLDVVGPPR